MDSTTPTPTLPAWSAADVLAGRSDWSVEAADLLEWLPRLPEGSVDLLFCSPPYEKARLYLEDGVNLGVARDTADWVDWMVEVCRSARRVCKGLCAFVVEGQTEDYRYTCSPHLLIAELHYAGFHLRRPPLYVRDGVCGSGGPDWLKNRYELIVCFTRGGKLPWSDNTACGHPPKFGVGGEISHRTLDGQRVNERRRLSKATSGHKNGDTSYRKLGYSVPEVANPGNLIDCGPAGGGNIGSHLAHENEAPFPEQLAAFFIRSFCPPGGIVCDPFSGSGTTASMALEWGRKFVGCDLRPSQVQLTTRRILETNRPLFPGM